MTLSWVGDVYVGAETGLVKSVQLHNQNWINLGGKPSEAKKENEILRMCWANQDESQVLMGLRSGSVFRVDVPSQSCVSLWSGADLHFGAESKFVGLESHEGNVFAAIQKGVWGVLRPNEAGIWAPAIMTPMQLKKQQDCRQLRVNTSASNGVVVATGGLNEHLKLWDVNAAAKTDEEGGPKPFFTAKNVKNDWLNLQVRTCVQDIRFLPGSDQVLTCTGYHQVRLYDPKTQRRPVVDFESGEFPLTCMDVVPSNTNHVIVGNTRGVMCQHDLRMKGRMVHGFKGFAGGLRDIRCHPSEPLVASVGLDRFLRVHNVVNHRITNKIYLKSRLNQCLFKTTLNEGLQLQGGEGEEEEQVGKTTDEREEGEGEGGEEDVWDQMETVGRKETKNDPPKEEKETNRKRKRKITIDEEEEEEEEEDEENENVEREATVTIVDEDHEDTNKKKKKKRMKS